MTTNEFARRIRRVADKALAAYDVDVRRVRMLPLATNVIFRVDTATGPFALRIAAPGWRDLVDLQAEAAWMSALAEDTALTVPAPQRSRDGEHLVAVDDGSRIHQAILMSWLPGQLLGRNLTTRSLFKMGELFARLHAHGLEWSPPTGFSQRRFDRVFSRGELDTWQNTAERSGVSADEIAVIRQVHDHVDVAYAALDPSDLRVVHGDLHHDNVMVDHGVLSPFDFEDTVWGYRIHDIAMAMLDLWDDAGPATYERLFDAFQRGYTKSSTWPEGDLTLFQLGRYVWRLNWTSNHRPTEIANAASATAEAFRYTLATGCLQPTRAHREAGG